MRHSNCEFILWCYILGKKVYSSNICTKAHTIEIEIFNAGCFKEKNFCRDIEIIINK